MHVTAIGVMLMIGAVTALVIGGLVAFSFVGLLWPGTYFSFALAIIAGIKAFKILGAGAHEELPPRTIAFLQIANIMMLDVVNVVLGITILILLSSPEASAYFRKPDSKSQS